MHASRGDYEYDCWNMYLYVIPLQNERFFELKIGEIPVNEICVFTKLFFFLRVWVFNLRSFLLTVDNFSGRPFAEILDIFLRFFLKFGTECINFLKIQNKVTAVIICDKVFLKIIFLLWLRKTYVWIVFSSFLNWRIILYIHSNFSIRRLTWQIDNKKYYFRNQPHSYECLPFFYVWKYINNHYIILQINIYNEYRELF